MLIHWIWLSTRPAWGSYGKKVLLDTFGDPERVYFASGEQYAQLEGIRAEQISALMDKDLKEAQAILNECVDEGIEICTFSQENYPYRLRHIPDPPLVLYYKGNLPDFQRAPLIGAVGTRKASPYGLNVARRLGYQIAACGGIVVSGAALGVDAMAMQGALLGNCPVVGVLGCGVDIVYPKTNRQLFDDILRCGCLVSEFPPKTPPYAGNFLKRNRIISGMSNGVVVIEAPSRSGSLNTARHALEQGRDVFVVPGNVDIPSFDGSNALLCDGATPVRDGWDVLRGYAAFYPDAVHPFQEEMPRQMESVQEPTAKKAVPAKKPSAERKDKKTIDKEQTPKYSDVNEILPKLPQTQRSIAELLTQPRLVDDIIAETGLSASKVSAALTVMEIKGIIRRLPGKRIALK